MKPLFSDVKSLLKNSIYTKEIRSDQISDEFHFHNAYEIALIIEGHGRRIVGDNVNSFSNGDLIMLGPNIAHASYSDKKYHIIESSSKVHAIVVYFQPDWITEHHMDSAGFAPLKMLLNQLKRGIKIEGKAHDVVRSHLLKLHNADGLKTFITLFQILYEVSKSKEFSFLASTRYSNTYNENDIKRINDVYKFVMENFTEVISLDDIAAIANMTPSSFCKYFKNKTNKTFTHFVNEIRINYACELLINRNLDICQISIQCGFNNFTSFNKNFKSFTKTTPSEFRSKIF